MLRALTACSLLLAVPLAAQVPTPPVARTAPTPPTPPARPSRYAPTASYSIGDALDVARSYSDLARTYLDTDLSYTINSNLEMQRAFDAVAPLATMSWSGDAFGGHGPRAGWAKDDPADSLYRTARDLLNRGDYRRSAAQFKELSQKFPASVYVNDAMYWQAFALYRIGGTPELQEALTVLEALKARTPAAEDSSRNRVPRAAVNTHGLTTTSVNGSTVISNSSSDHVRAPMAYDYSVGSAVSWSSGSRNDAVALAARIAKVLSQRGLATDAAVKRALAAAGTDCDVEDQQVRSEALMALMRSDPALARQSAGKILARRDDCSVPLRRSAVSMLASTRDDATAALLIPIAKSDPSSDVQVMAIESLARMPGDAAFTTLRDLASGSTREQVQWAAVRALASSSDPRARVALRAMVEKSDTPDQLRISALSSYGRESSADDVAWLRGLYGKTTSPQVKSMIVSTVARIGGDASDQWLASLVKSDDEPMEARMSALRQAGRSMDVAALGKLYDGSSQAQIRSTVIDLLANRKEPAAVDQLIDIAKNGTDPRMRRSAIAALARSKDPRAQKLLLDLVDHL